MHKLNQTIQTAIELVFRQGCIFQKERDRSADFAVGEVVFPAEHFDFPGNRQRGLKQDAFVNVFFNME